MLVGLEMHLDMDKAASFLDLFVHVAAVSVHMSDRLWCNAVREELYRGMHAFMLHTVEAVIILC